MADFRRSRFYLPLMIISLALLYWAGARFGLAFAMPNSVATLIWPPAGLSLAALLIFGWRIWPGVLLGAFIAELSAGLPALTAGLIAFGNLGEALLGCYLLKRYLAFDCSLSRLRDVFGLIFLAAGLSTLLAALAGTASLLLGQHIQPEIFASVFTHWWMGDALSDLLFAPAIFAIFYHEPIRWNSFKWKEAGILAVLMLYGSLFVFLGAYQDRWFIDPKLFMLFPLAIWAALSFHQLGAAFSSIFLILMSLVGAAYRLGYFAEDYLKGDFFNLWLFAAVLSVTGICLSVINAGRLRFEQKFRDQLDLYNALIQAQSDVDEGVAVIEKGKIIYGNDAFWRIGGYRQGDFAIGSDFLQLIHPSDRERVAEMHVRRMQGLTVPGRYEAMGLSKDGEPVFIEIAATRYRDGSDRVVALIIDITERKRAEKALAHSQAEYRELVESVQAVMWRADPDGSFTFVSHEAEALLGYPLAQWTEEPTFWKDHIHPDDRDWVVAYCMGESLKLKSHAFEYRMIAADERTLWMQDIVRVIPNKAGDKPQELVGVMLDITARKEAEAGLRLSRQVFENTAEGIVITDRDFNIIEVNQAYTRITGYSQQDVIGRQPPEFATGLHASYFYDEIKRILHLEDRWAGEIWNRRKNGESYPEWLSISKVTDSKGTLENYVAVFTDITLIKQSEERLQFLANHDALTRLPNRALLQERIDQALLRAQRNQTKLAVLFIDLDRFKVINDTLGHQAGDMLLQEAANRIKECMRLSDTVARQGGDEFVVLVEDFSDSQYLTGVAQKLMAALGLPFILMGQELYITASIGISVYPEDGNDLFSLLKNADVAMYRAKESGKNTFHFYAAESNTHSLERLALENSLRRAIERNEFMLLLQPKVDLRTQQIVGAEALLRWQHPELGIVSPAEFIPLAEETGLILPIGIWALREACRLARDCQLQFGRKVPVAVNLSARQFREDDLLQTITAALADSGLGADCLELEITESIIMQNAEHASDTLQYFRNLGTRVLIDDFGTGYSSLGYLKQFPIDSLKIDRSFIQDIPADSDDVAITQAIIAMAHSLDIKVVAEGVETEAQLKFLRQQGCDQIQGYVFSQPLMPDRFLQLLQDHAKA